MASEEIKRKNLICYFLAVSKAQKQVQALQQKLIIHEKFNPVALFKKISNHQPYLSCKKLKEFIISNAITKNQQAIQIYLKSHKFKDSIKCQQFINSVLPYTPDVLRNAKSTIIWQVEGTKGVSYTVQKYYMQILQRQIFHILRLSSLRKTVFPKGNYSDVKKFIIQDMRIHGELKDKHIPETVDLMLVRRWLQIWINIDEYEILNMMRWFQGDDEESISRGFSCVYVKEVQCQCYEKKNYKRDQKNVYFEKKSNSPRNASQSQIIQLWCQYVFTIIQSEKDMQMERMRLEQVEMKVRQILKNEVMSKKKSFTPIKKMFAFIEKYLGVDQKQLKKWENILGSLTLQNNVLFTIFFHESHEQQSLDLSFTFEVRQKIAKVLKSYCEAKYHLIKISKKIMKKKACLKMFKILNQNQRYITAKMLAEILQQMSIEYDENDINVLMKHFGDGKLITQLSFKNVFQIQGS